MITENTLLNFLFAKKTVFFKDVQERQQAQHSTKEGNVEFQCKTQT